MKFTSLLLLAILFPAVISFPAGAADVVARVGGRDITLDDVRDYIETLPEADQTALAKNPSVLPQVVRQYLAREQVLKEAKEKKFDQQADVKVKLARVQDVALLELYLQSVAKIPDAFPSEAELQTAYEANKTAFVAPRQYKLSQIFIAAPKDAKAPAKLDEVTKKLRARGADFAAIAKEFSDADAGKGGDLGWLSENQIVQEIRQAVSGLSKEGVSDPIRLDDGWHILKLADTKPAGVLPLAEVKNSLKERLRQVRGQQLRQAYLAKLAQENPAVLNELALSKLPQKGR